MNKYHLSLVLVLAVCGCAKSADQSEAGSSSGAILSAPAGCTSAGSGVHNFQDWGPLSATNYTCSSFPKLDCTLSVSTAENKTEMICHTTTAGLYSGPPAECSYYSHGLRDFTPTLLATADSYDCGMKFNKVRCFYHIHIPDGAEPTEHEDVVCLDDDY